MSQAIELASLLVLTVAALSACGFSGPEFSGTHFEPEQPQGFGGEEAAREPAPYPPGHIP